MNRAGFSGSSPENPGRFTHVWLTELSRALGRPVNSAVHLPDRVQSRGLYLDARPWQSLVFALVRGNLQATQSRRDASAVCRRYVLGEMPFQRLNAWAKLDASE